MQLLDIEKLDNAVMAEVAMLGILLGFILEAYVETPTRKRKLYVVLGLLAIAASSLINPLAVVTVPLGLLIGYSVARLYNWVALKWFY